MIDIHLHHILYARMDLQNANDIQFSHFDLVDLIDSSLYKNLSVWKLVAFHNGR